MNPTVTLKRLSDDGVQTQGLLYCNGFSCKTLERSYKDNKPYISSIPKGLYLVKWSFSLRLLQYTYEVKNVLGRAGIRFHRGNFFFDVDGCILLGNGFTDLNKDGKVDIINSTTTLSKFVSLMGKKDFNLQII